MNVKINKIYRYKRTIAELQTQIGKMQFDLELQTQERDRQTRRVIDLMKQLEAYKDDIQTGQLLNNLQTGHYIRNQDGVWVTGLRNSDIYQKGDTALEALENAKTSVSKQIQNDCQILDDTYPTPIVHWQSRFNDADNEVQKMMLRVKEREAQLAAQADDAKLGRLVCEMKIGMALEAKAPNAWRYGKINSCGWGAMGPAEALESAGIFDPGTPAATDAVLGTAGLTDKEDTPPTVECPRCHGTGEICHSTAHYSNCPHCGGNGIVNQTSPDDNQPAAQWLLAYEERGKRITELSECIDALDCTKQLQASMLENICEALGCKPGDELTHINQLMGDRADACLGRLVRAMHDSTSLDHFSGSNWGLLKYGRRTGTYSDPEQALKAAGICDPRDQEGNGATQ